MLKNNIRVLKIINFDVSQEMKCENDFVGDESDGGSTSS